MVGLAPIRGLPTSVPANLGSIQIPLRKKVGPTALKKTRLTTTDIKKVYGFQKTVFRGFVLTFIRNVNSLIEIGSIYKVSKFVDSLKTPQELLAKRKLPTFRFSAGFGVNVARALPLISIYFFMLDQAIQSGTYATTK